MEKGVDWESAQQRVGQTAKSYRICMEFVWNLYGTCMEFVWNNTLATRNQHPRNRRAPRQAARAGVVGSPTELVGATSEKAEQLGAWNRGHYRGRGKAEHSRTPGR